MYRFVEIGLILALSLFIVGGCSGKRPDGIGIDSSGLRGCHKSPNCVSSEAKDGQHAIELFRLKRDFNVSWSLLHDEIESMPRWILSQQPITTSMWNARVESFDLLMILNYTSIHRKVSFRFVRRLASAIQILVRIADV